MTVSCFSQIPDEGGQVVDTVLDPSNTCFWVSSEAEERDGHVYLARRLSHSPGLVRIVESRKGGAH